MLFAGSSAETDATLRAMKHVATAGGARPLSDPDRVALRAAHTVAFGADGVLDPGALPDDTLSHDWDFWAHVDEPLDAVRDAMGVAQLDPADAADGEYPDWYHPSA
jgi:hypothetical protein